jgi:GT2 family glycosyltransferase/glycosyltransferase involved in cell wall biosynthesis
MLNTYIDFTADSDTELLNKIQDWLKKFPSIMPVVVIPVFNAYDDTIECLQSIIVGQVQSTPILLIDDASTDDRIQSILEPLSHKGQFLYVRKSQNSGFVGSANLAFTACNPHDVVIVNSDTVLPPGWLERMQEAAYSYSNIATVTPFTNNGTIVSLPYRNRPLYHLLKNMTVNQLDAKVASNSLKIRPIIPTAIGHCTYFKRYALEVVGYFDTAFAPGYGEEVDFSQRAVIAGFCHVVADDVFIFHKGSRSFGLNSENKRRLQEDHEQMLKVRYPWYHHWVKETQENSANSLATAINIAKNALLGYHIAVDATCLDESVTGTQVVTLELIKALGDTRPANTELSVIISDHVHFKVLAGLDKVVDKVERLSEVISRAAPTFDLVYRPFQISKESDLATLQKIAHYMVISHLDCIAFSNPSYFPNWEQWVDYRYITQLTFANADGITFISKNALKDALHQGLAIPEERTKVCYVGVDHQVFQSKEVAPATEVDLENQSFLLVLGTNFNHKNRLQTLKIYKALVDKYNWQGKLVYAGPEVQYGGSNGTEALEKLRFPYLANKIIQLGAVNEAEKQWLLKHANLLFYLSNYEGFGIPPFEAAQRGTPVLTTALSSLKEVLGEEVLYLEDMYPESAADLVYQLLTNKDLAHKQIAAIKNQANLYTWAETAKRTWDFLLEIVQSQPRSRQTVTKDTFEERLTTLQEEFQKLENWAGGLNQRLTELEAKKAYRALTRFRLL